MAFLGRLLKYCFKGVISLELPRCLQGGEVQVRQDRVSNSLKVSELNINLNKLV